MTKQDKVIYERICIEIENNQSIAFSRWGDGEWYNIEKRTGCNCDGNIYYPDLGEELKDIISEKQEYYIGKQNSTTCYSLADNFQQDWIHADLFHRASIAGDLNRLIHALDGAYVVYIGNKDLKKLPFFNEFIEIPSKNIWLKRDGLMKQIKSTMNDTHKTYCFSAGMATNVFIDWLWKYDNTNSYIDVGSVFDPYVGKCTRRYHRKLNI